MVSLAPGDSSRDVVGPRIDFLATVGQWATADRSRQAGGPTRAFLPLLQGDIHITPGHSDLHQRAQLTGASQEVYHCPWDPSL